ncbi:DUF2058 domain-containing protein [Desulfocicer niacini]
MLNSFQEQLLKTGLVSKKQVNKAQHEKRVKKQVKKGKKGQQEKQEPKESSIAREERLAFEAHNRELNRQRNEERKRRESVAQVRQLVLKNKLTLEARDDDEPYHFVVKKRIKKMFVPSKIGDQLTNGQMAIVNLDGRFELVPGDVARQIAQRDRKCLVVFHEGETEAESVIDVP